MEEKDKLQEWDLSLMHKYFAKGEKTYNDRSEADLPFVCAACEDDSWKWLLDFLQGGSIEDYARALAVIRTCNCSDAEKKWMNVLIAIKSGRDDKEILEYVRGDETILFGESEECLDIAAARIAETIVNKRGVSRR